MNYQLLPIATNLVVGLLMGCATSAPDQNRAAIGPARVTYYCSSEDRRWGNTRADGGKIQPCRTAAMSKEIPFGSAVRIPALLPVIGNQDFTVQDRGSAVESRKASRGLLPIVDIAVESKRMVNWLAAVMPPVLVIE